MTFDFFDPGFVWAFSETDPNPGIYMIATMPPYTATPLSYSKLGGQNANGGSVDPATGNIYVADFQGDVANIDDNIHLLDRTGATIAFWETDVGTAGTPCSGGAVNQIVDVAVDHDEPGRVYATSTADNLIYELNLSNTSGTDVAPSPCLVVGTFPAPGALTNVRSIEYDPCKRGFWLADGASDTIVLVDDDGTFSTVREGISSGATYTGAAPVFDGMGLTEVWASAPTAIDRLDSGSDECVGSFDGPVPDPIGIAFDFFDPTAVWIFREGDPDPGIFRVETTPPYASTALTYTKLGNPDTDGGSIDPVTGDIFAADFNGDLVSIDDNIYRFDRTGATVAFWETDGGLAGTPCSGGAVGQIIDVAVDHDEPGRVYATSTTDNLIYDLDLSDTSGGDATPSPCVVNGTFPAPAAVGNVLGIEYDPCSGGFWLSDNGSNNIVLVDDDGTFQTVLHTIVNAPINTGVTPVSNGMGNVEAWVVNIFGGSDVVTAFDGGQVDCICGDGILDFAEDCDDGNVDDGDCCSAICAFEASGATCSDGNACTDPDTCDGAGTCTAGAAVVCAACETCEPASGCGANVLTTCRRPRPGKGSLLLKDKSNDKKDKLVWGWKKGDATDVADFGAPTTTDDYALCMFDVSGMTPAVVGSARVLAGAAWKDKGAKGFKYKDKTRSPDGILSARLKPGVAGKANVILKGKGANLPLPALPLNAPLTVQLQGANGQCWEATYDAGSIKKNTSSTFKGKGS